MEGGCCSTALFKYAPSAAGSAAGDERLFPAAGRRGFAAVLARAERMPSRPAPPRGRVREVGLGCTGNDSLSSGFEGNYEDYEKDFKRRKGADADTPHRIKYGRIDA